MKYFPPSFCGLAALLLLGKERLCNLEVLLVWAAARQMRCEGGFQGRTNKLVDACYSFWQGGLFPLLHSMLAQQQDTADCLPEAGWLCDERALQQYLLVCCQVTSSENFRKNICSDLLRIPAEV